MTAATTCAGRSRDCRGRHGPPDRFQSGTTSRYISARARQDGASSQYPTRRARTIAIADNRLTAFIETALKAGASRQQIEDALKTAGWSKEQIRDGLGRFAPVDFVVPVPQPRPELSARDAFMYLLMFAALYLSAYQLGNLLFQLVNLAFPDELAPPPYAVAAAGRNIRWATSALIVAFPVFLFVASRIARGVAEQPARRNSAIRKWLTYLTLFVAATIIVGDLIALVFNLLNGELTVRFVLKVLIVGGIAGGLFGYYLWSAKADDEALGR